MPDESAGFQRVVREADNSRRAYFSGPEPWPGTQPLMDDRSVTRLTETRPRVLDGPNHGQDAADLECTAKPPVGRLSPEAKRPRQAYSGDQKHEPEQPRAADKPAP